MGMRVSQTSSDSPLSVWMVPSIHPLDILTSAKLAYAPEGMPIPETPENSRKPGSPPETPERLGSPPETPEKQAFLMTLWKSQLFSGVLQRTYTHTHAWHLT